ncbi:MAG: preprotein translocase subunit YajC [Planctomycetes bacterium]|nr:preprotein translocase subunit YajC [Planctomycetota bacterium]
MNIWLSTLAASEGQVQPLAMLMPFILIFIIMYFLMLRPQKRKEAERRQMIEAVKKNDEVVTIGGIHGKVVSVRGDEVVLKLDKKGDIRVTFNKSAVSRIVTGDDAPKDEGEAPLSEDQQ